MAIYTKKTEKNIYTYINAQYAHCKLVVTSEATLAKYVASSLLLEELTIRFYFIVKDLLFI
jgi:hypothetical protein